MRQEDLPTSVEELQRLLMEERQRTVVAEQRTVVAEQRTVVAEQRTTVAKQQTVELTATIDKQKKQLDQFEFKIRELLQALRGKQRERIDPSQLMLFDIGAVSLYTSPSPRDRQKSRMPSSA